MQKIDIHNKNKDISDKGQKIVGALYLMTEHLSDTEPLKCTVRTKALTLFEDATSTHRVVNDLINLLKAASVAKILNDRNIDIIKRELMLFDQHLEDGVSLDPLFANQTPVSSRTKILPQQSFIAESMSLKSQDSYNKNDSKGKRQEQILSFINGRKSAVIKDISTLFPDVSEKTIQRELGTMVEAGKITKRGSKRWSIYMAI